ncbi:MAG: EAL domain-containing protein [Fibrobacterota bacterium]|nr:EAL domain-containing protein [Fibrobacterota bacterium]QQS04949.1 MAG: EAL domain-containing protein [Fibrobacterota bacterium]
MPIRPKSDIGIRRTDWTPGQSRKVSYRTEEHTSELVAVLSAAEELVGAPDVDTLLRRTVEIARDTIGLERVSIYLEDDSGRVMRGTWGTDLAGTTTDEREYAYAKGEPEERAHLVHGEGSRWLVLDDAPLMSSEDGESHMIRRGWLCLTPIRSIRGPIGLLFNDTARTSTPFDASRQELVAVLCSLVANIIERKRAEELLLERAMFDDCTGLPSQALFLDRLHRRCLQEREEKFAVGVLALDRWTTISESYAPHFHESLLSAVAQRLSACLRVDDTICRLSNNEFAFLLDPVVTADEAGKVLENTLEELSKALQVEGEPIHVTASAGFAFHETTVPGAEEHLQDARAALARSRVHSPGRVGRFRSEDRELLMSGYRLENELHKAVDSGDFLLHFQPIVNLASGELHGFETLVRWIHATRGMILPGMFIPMAEENGLIRPLGEWVLAESCRQAGQWRMELGGYASGLSLSVNLSVRQFLQRDLVDRIERILDKSGMPPRLLHLEITESVVMEDPELARSVLARLKSLGVLLSLDDFGTGFSSFSYLTRLPLDALKIDRSFVIRLGQDTRTEAVVRAVCDLSRDLGMEVIAEGVETQTQLDALRSFACQYVQGFLVSRPLDNLEASELLRSGTPLLPADPMRRITRRMPVYKPT